MIKKQFKDLVKVYIFYTQQKSTHKNWYGPLKHLKCDKWHPSREYHLINYIYQLVVWNPEIWHKYATTTFLKSYLETPCIIIHFFFQLLYTCLLIRKSKYVFIRLRCVYYVQQEEGASVSILSFMTSLFYIFSVNTH